MGTNRGGVCLGIRVSFLDEVKLAVVEGAEERH